MKGKRKREMKEMERREREKERRVREGERLWNWLPESSSKTQMHWKHLRVFFINYLNN